LADRAAVDLLCAPVSIYECHLESWRRTQNDDGSWRPLTYREAAEILPSYVADLGFTHVEFLPLAQYPFDGSWGYQVTGYYAPAAQFGSPDDFRYLIDNLHQAGIGVIVDWVAAHFPKDGWALARFDGTALYEHADPRQGEHPDWGTLVFNFGRHEVRNFLLANALYWIEEFHLDGLRVDAVASMLYPDYSWHEGEAGQSVRGRGISRRSASSKRSTRSSTIITHR
jgi:1,4-alpha-glucan branching enzyme